MTKTRKIFSKLLPELENNKILLLVWPRQVGKTTLLKQLQEEVKNKKTFFINLEFEDKKVLLDENPLNLFEITWIKSTEEQIIFIDEVQYLRNPSNFLKLIYDEYHQNIKLVVSGSSSFYIDKKFKDSLMGRKEFPFLDSAFFLLISLLT
jgi:predicted AAA+ superfamily ATPase